MESVFIHTNTSSLQTLGSPSLLLHSANQGGGSEELPRNKKQIEQGRTGKWSSIPLPLDPQDHRGLLVLSPDLPVPWTLNKPILEPPSRSPYVCQYLLSCFWLFGWEKRPPQPHCPTELISTRTFSLLSSSTLLHFDGPKCFKICLTTTKQKVSPSQMCSLVLLERKCIPLFAQHGSPGPAGTCPGSGQHGHFSETTSENTQLHDCALAPERTESRGLRFHHKPGIIKFFNHTALLAG